MLWVYIVGVACVVNVKVNKVLCPVEALVSRVLGEGFRRGFSEPAPPLFVLMRAQCRCLALCGWWGVGKPNSSLGQTDINRQ